MGGEDKILYELGGMPVLIHSLRPFEESELVDEIIIVTRRDAVVEISQLCKAFGMTKVTKILPGGATRMDSVLIGLGEVEEGTELVAIHDGARPLLPREVLEHTVEKAAECGAAAPGIPAKDTMKVVEGGIIKETVPREQLYAIQTPQVFEVSLLRGALFKAKMEGAALTDDCSAVERLGYSVVVTPGSEENRKLTTPEDLLLAEAILAGRVWL